MTGPEAQKIVLAYSQALGTQVQGYDHVCDAGKLPFSKDVIKRALLNLLARAQNHLETQKMKFIYAQLAKWQDGVGDESINLPDVESGITRRRWTQWVGGHGSRPWTWFIFRRFRGMVKAILISG
jgi:hypothetical protein